MLVSKRGSAYAWPGRWYALPGTRSLNPANPSWPCSMVLCSYFPWPYPYPYYFPGPGLLSLVPRN